MERGSAACEVGGGSGLQRAACKLFGSGRATFSMILAPGSISNTTAGLRPARVVNRGESQQVLSPRARNLHGGAGQTAGFDVVTHPGGGNEPGPTGPVRAERREQPCSHLPQKLDFSPPIIPARRPPEKRHNSLGRAGHKPKLASLPRPLPTLVRRSKSPSAGAREARRRRPSRLTALLARGIVTLEGVPMLSAY
jgi:hypothetical protein